MHDRVADVLAQRTRLDRGAGTAVALSLLLHGAMAATGIYLALRRPDPISAPAINIRFAPSAPAAVKTAAGRTRSTPVEKPRTEPVAPPKPAEPRIEAPKPEVEKPATAPVEKNTAPTSAFGRSTKKGSDSPPVPVPKSAAPSTTLDGSASAAAGAASAADVPVGGAGVTGLEGGDFPYTLYIERMKTLIGNRWIRPQVSAGTTTTVYFVINRDGSVRDSKVQSPSGHGTFDRAALRAVLESSPLPPLPYGYTGTYLGVHLTFK
jgi:TonB family protein